MMIRTAIVCIWTAQDLPDNEVQSEGGRNQEKRARQGLGLHGNWKRFDLHVVKLVEISAVEE